MSAQPRFLSGGTPFRQFLRSGEAVLIHQELNAAIDQLAAALHDVDDGAYLQQALRSLRRSIDLDDSRGEQMMGHGKRWLTRLLQLLQASPAPDAVDRLQVCGQLARGLSEVGASPAAVFGEALTTLRSLMRGGADANGLRTLLQERVLSLFAKETQLPAPEADSPDLRVKALQAGFGFVPTTAALRPLLKQLSIETLNVAAGCLEDRQGSQLFPVAHDLIRRFNHSFHSIWGRPAPASEVLSPVEEREVQVVLNALALSLDINLAAYLRTSSPLGPARWQLHDSGVLYERLKAALPELSVPVPLGHPELPSPPQDNGSGATGVFSAGTGGASNRGPS